MQAVWRKYVQAMRQAGFSAGVGVYVASGLLTYGASQGAPLLAPVDLPTNACLPVQSHQRVSPRNAKASDACMPHMLERMHLYVRVSCVDACLRGLALAPKVARSTPSHCQGE